jgi:hypothetical protein
MLKCILALMAITVILPAACLAQETDFRFGAMGNQAHTYNGMSAARLDSMKNILGFDLYCPLGADGETINLMGDSLKLIPDFTYAPNNARYNYIYSHYGVVEAEDNTRLTRFLINTGSPPVNGFVFGPRAVPGTAAVFLDSLWYKHQNGNEDEQFSYGLRVKVGPLESLVLDDTLGFLKLMTGVWWGNLHASLVDTFFVVSNPFIQQQVETLEIMFNPIAPPSLDYVSIATYQKCDFGVDYFKVYNEKGHRLVDLHNFIDDLLGFAQDYSISGNVLNWYLRDEPTFTQWIPYHVVDSALTANNLPAGNSAFAEFGLSSDFLDIAQPAALWIDPYPLYGGQFVTQKTYYSSGDSVITSWQYTITQYTGSNGPPIWYQSTPLERGLQYQIDSLVVRHFNTAASACAQFGKPLWYIPQAFGQKKLTSLVLNPDPGIDSIRYIADNGWWWRPPTRSELGCITFVGMCFPVEAVTYWRYDSYYNSGSWGYWNYGIIAIDENQDFSLSPMWYKIKADIAPYMNAIADIFADLSWERGYAYHQGTPQVSPPANAFVSSISAFSNPCGGVIDETECNNPDLGWFHLGEFYNDEDNPYVMIVNRACSQGPDDNSEAPSITATIRFNPTNLGIGDYVYVIDLASGTDSSNWEGVPETTYTAVMPDGTIPFTAVFKAGEGRLLCISPIAR